MKKFLILVFTIMFSFNAYAELTDCQHTLDVRDNSDVLSSLYMEKDYAYGSTNGKLCFVDEDGATMAFLLKRGKLAGPMEYQLNVNNKPGVYIYASSYKFIDNILNLTMSPDDLNKMSKITGKYHFIMEFYNDGNKTSVIDLNKGRGYMLTYRENGVKEYFIPIKKFRIHGTSELYDEQGILYATVKFKNDKMVSGRCIVDGKKGRKLTIDELTKVRDTNVCK